MSISPNRSQVSASSSSLTGHTTQSSSLDNGKSFRPPSNDPLGGTGDSSSPSPPLSGEVVSAALNSGEASVEIKSGQQNQSVNSISQHPDAILHLEGVASLVDGSSAEQEKPRGSFVSPRGQEGAAPSAGLPGSRHVVGRKARTVSGNGLLNFQYEPIPASRPQPRVPSRRQKTQKHYNKDLFFQANYRFVILDTGNYSVHSLDPDSMLSWEDIICLKHSTPVPVLCPICLDDPLCPQITSCGHIFCFPCILRYFYIDKDGTKEDCWKKCPMCFTMISSKDLYTVQLEIVKQYHIGDKIDFVLLTRQKGSFSSSVRNCETTNVEDEMINSFSKFILTSDVDLSVREAMADLDSWIAKAQSGLVDDIEMLPYVCAAVEQLEKRKIYWDKRHSLNAADESEISLSPPLISPANPSLSASSMNTKSDRSGKSSQEKEVGQLSSSPAEGSSHLSEIQEKSPSSSYEGNKGFWPNSSYINEKMSYNFYQAVDGQHIILTPFNMKCLLQHFGSSDQLPDRITGNIVDLETVSQSEVMRRRYRFLSHLPLTTTFQLCEINLADLLPAEALSPFMGEIKDREKQRKRLARKEMKEKIKAEAAASQFFAEPHYSYETPSFSMDDFEALGSSIDAPPRPPPMTGQCQSFSAVTRLGFAAACDSPALKNEESQTGAKISGSSSRGTASASSFASIISSNAKQDQVVDAPRTNDAVKKGKKTTRILLSTAGGRRY